MSKKTILSILRVLIGIFIFLVVYGVFAAIIAPINYVFAAPFIVVASFLSLPFLFIVGSLQRSAAFICGDMGCALALSELMVILIYLIILEVIYRIVKKKSEVDL